MKTALKKIWHGWKRMAHRFARFQTIVFLTIFYCLILAPLGSLLRFFSWDPLEAQGFSSKKLSNWKKIATPSLDMDSLKRQS